MQLHTATRAGVQMGKAMAGRKRKRGLSRYRGGQITRQAREDEARAVVIEARMRQFGISKSAAADPYQGSPLGRLRRKGYLSQEQYEAGIEFAETMTVYLVEAQLPRVTPRCVEAGHIHTFGVPVTLVDDESSRRAEKAQERARVLMEVLGDQDRLDAAERASGRSATAIVWKVCMTDADEWYTPYELGQLREGLNAVERAIGKEAKMKRRRVA